MTEGAMSCRDQRLSYSELDQICDLVGKCWYQLLNRLPNGRSGDRAGKCTIFARSKTSIPALRLTERPSHLV